MQNEQPPNKNGGAASQVCQGKEGASAETESTLQNKNVSPFCNDCRPVPWNWHNKTFREFIDREGLAWHCFKLFTCEHAVIINGAIVSCRVRTAQLNQEAAE